MTTGGVLTFEKWQKVLVKAQKPSRRTVGGGLVSTQKEQGDPGPLGEWEKKKGGVRAVGGKKNKWIPTRKTTKRGGTGEKKKNNKRSKGSRGNLPQRRKNGEGQKKGFNRKDGHLKTGEQRGGAETWSGELGRNKQGKTNNAIGTKYMAGKRLIHGGNHKDKGEENGTVQRGGKNEKRTKRVGQRGRCWLHHDCKNGQVRGEGGLQNGSRRKKRTNNTNNGTHSREGMMWEKSPRTNKTGKHETSDNPLGLTRTMGEGNQAPSKKETRRGQKGAPMGKR